MPRPRHWAEKSCHQAGDMLFGQRKKNQVTSLASPWPRKKSGHQTAGGDMRKKSGRQIWPAATIVFPGDLIFPRKILPGGNLARALEPCYVPSPKLQHFLSDLSEVFVFKSF